VVPVPHVELGKIFGLGYALKEFADERERVAIFSGDLVKTAVIDAKAQ
jgi:hypothetical protein